nr:glycosyltransferase family 4 protein [Hufsiella ginkgonis]
MKKLARVHTLLLGAGENRLQFFLSLNRRIRQLCKANPGITVIHFNDALVASVSLFHTGYAHLKRTATVHGLDVVYPNLLYRRFVFHGLKRLDLVIPVSQATARACTRLGIPPGNLLVINNGVDEQAPRSITREQADRLLQNRFGIDTGGRRLLVAMGRPVKRKGFSWFIKNVLPQLDPAFMLLLIGPIPNQEHIGGRIFRRLPAFARKPFELMLALPSDERPLQQLLAKRPYRHRVFRTGKLSREVIGNLLSVADAFVMPNIEVSGDMEGFGLVCLEASICGARVLASASGGIPDAISDGENGLLLPPGDADSWIRALNNPSDTLPGAASRIAFTRRQFSWEKMTKEYLEAFSRI